MPKLSETAQQSRRSHILDAAEACFARAGFHRTTMQDICREAGVSPGALYLYFASKEALIAGLVERDRRDVLAELDAAAEQSDVIDGLSVALRRCVVEAPAHKPAMLLEIGAESRHNPAIARIVRECDGAIRARLELLLAQAQQDSAIAPAAAITDVAAIMALVADGLFWRRAIDPDFDCAALAPHVVAMLRSLVSPPAAAAPSLEAAPAPLPALVSVQPR